MTIGGSDRLWWVSLLVAAVMVVIVSGIGFLRQPLIEDEVEYAEVARSYISNGQPLAHVSGQVEAVLHHPQLYHLMIAVASVVGGAEWGGRCLGVILLLASAWLGGLLAKAIWSESNVGLVAAILILLCPLCFRGAYLLDIDNTLLPVVSLGFLVVAVQQGKRRILILTGLFAVALWIKLTTPLLLLIPLWMLWGGKQWRHVVLVAVVGFLLFAITWVGFCHWKELPVMGPLWHLIGKGSSGMGLTWGNVMGELGKRLVRYVLWLSPFLFLWLFKPLPKSKLRRALLALGCFVIINLVFYWFVGGHAFGFPRYQIPAVMVAIVLLAPLVSKGWEELGVLVLWRWVIVTGGTAFFLWSVGDVLFPFYSFPERFVIDDITRWDLIGYTIRVLIALLVFFAIVSLVWKSKFRTLRQGVVMLSVVVLFPWWVSQDLAMANASYNTGYLYGEQGIREVGELLGQTLYDGQVIVASKDVAYYSGYRFPHKVLGNLCEQEDLSAILISDSVGAMVYRRGQIIDSVTGPCLASDKVRAILDTYYKGIRIGDFDVWLRREIIESDLRDRG